MISPASLPPRPPLPPTRTARRASFFRALRRWMFRALLALVLLVSAAAVYAWWTRPVPCPMTEIYQGVWYECRQMPPSPEASGLAHLVRVDLSTPGVDLYVSPRDPAAVAENYEYTTRWTPSLAGEVKAAVLVNGTLFTTRHNSRLPGDFARTVETVVSNHEINHEWGYSHMLTFDDHLAPRLEPRPPNLNSLVNAKWAVGAQFITYTQGRYYPESSPLDRRTMLGINPAKKLLFIGVFDRATYRGASQALVELGATDCLPLDGGTSTAFVLGPDTRNVRPGTKVYPLRALAVHFGVRANKLP